VNIIETYLLPTAYGGAGGGGGGDGGGGDGASKDSEFAVIPDPRNYAKLSKHFTINSSFVGP